MTKEKKMSKRNFRTVDAETKLTASVWGVAEFTKQQCVLLDRYAAARKLTPSQFLVR